jgi:hypothetical protein
MLSTWTIAFGFYIYYYYIYGTAALDEHSLYMYLYIILTLCHNYHTMPLYVQYRFILLDCATTTIFTGRG